MASPVSENSKLRVLQMTARADMGGGPRHIFDLLNGLKHSTVENHVASPLDKPWGPNFQTLATGFIEIPHRRFSLFVLWRLVRYVRRNRIAIIHSHGRGAGYYSRFLGVLTRRPVIHTYHGVFVEKPFLSKLKLHADRWLASFPFFGLFVSRSERFDALDAGVIRRQKFAILANAVDLERFEAAARVHTPTVRRIGCFLRPTSQKGPDLLLKLAQACEPHAWAQDLKFECAGMTNEQLAGFDRVPASIIGQGMVAEPASWLAGLDLFISTARHEGLPIGVLEAMAAGTPCFLSEISAHAQFFAADVAIPLDLLKPFAPQVEALLNDPARLADVAARAREYVHQDFSLSAFSQKLIAIYRTVLG